VGLFHHWGWWLACWSSSHDFVLLFLVTLMCLMAEPWPMGMSVSRFGSEVFRKPAGGLGSGLVPSFWVVFSPPVTRRGFSLSAWLLLFVYHLGLEQTYYYLGRSPYLGGWVVGLGLAFSSPCLHLGGIALFHVGVVVHTRSFLSVLMDFCYTGCWATGNGNAGCCGVFCSCCSLWGVTLWGALRHGEIHGGVKLCLCTFLCWLGLMCVCAVTRSISKRG
jgi:hypothetical protein